MKVGIQGERGSACDAAAAQLTKGLEHPQFEFLCDAQTVLAALASGKIDAAVLAMESPIGSPISETRDALKQFPLIREISELRSEVRHCVMAAPGCGQDIRTIASHPIPLEKHKRFLRTRFPGYEPLPMLDTGVAAQQLATSELPTNEGYLTRFALVEWESDA